MGDEPTTEPRGGLPAIGPFAALQFLTRLPVRLRRAPDMAAMVVWFPLAGAVIGALAGGLEKWIDAHRAGEPLGGAFACRK